MTVTGVSIVVGAHLVRDSSLKQIADEVRSYKCMIWESWDVSYGNRVITEHDRACKALLQVHLLA